MKVQGKKSRYRIGEEEKKLKDKAMPFFLCTGFFCCCYCYSCAHISRRAISIWKLRVRENIPKKPFLPCSSTKLLFLHGFLFLFNPFASFSFFLSLIDTFSFIIFETIILFMWIHPVWYSFHSVLHLLVLFTIVVDDDDSSYKRMSFCCNGNNSSVQVVYFFFFAFWVTVFISPWRIFVFFVYVSVLSFCFVLPGATFKHIYTFFVSASLFNFRSIVNINSLIFHFLCLS